VKYLNEKGADGSNKNGKTTIHYVALEGKLELVKYLTEKGTDIKCK
jgi:hypothetical protein